MVNKSQVQLENLRISIHDAMRQKLVEDGADIETINLIMKLHDITLSRQVATQIVREKLSVAGLESAEALSTSQIAEKNPWNKNKLKFYNWWVKQSGGGDGYLSRERLKGTIKKAAVIGAIGVPIGLIGSFSPLGGGVIFAAAAIKGVNSVKRGLAGASIEKDSKVTVAIEQMRARSAKQTELIEQAYKDSDKSIVKPKTVTDQYLEGTKQEVIRNRKRAIRSVGLLAVGSAAGLVAADAL
jgi:hypothetical protein